MHFISTINIGDQIRDAIRKAGFYWRPYDLNHYFATQTLEAESKGTGLTWNFRVFLMGHNGDIEHQYTLNNRTLSTERIEQIRSVYAKALKYLETEPKGQKEEEGAKITSGTMRKTAIMILETAYGMNLSDREKEDLMATDVNELQDRLRNIFREKKDEIFNGENKHKTIPECDLGSYLNNGWELVQIYPQGDKAFIKLPS